ncbi:hypothetical protein GQ457_11G029440 [Hibiscus cannabinus]
MFAASFDSKMGCLYSVFDVKKQGKPVWEVRTRNWKLREGGNRLSGLLEGISIASVGKARRQGDQPKILHFWCRVSIPYQWYRYPNPTLEFGYRYLLGRVSVPLVLHQFLDPLKPDFSHLGPYACHPLIGHESKRMSRRRPNETRSFRCVVNHHRMVVYRSWIFGLDSGIPRVTISGRFCDWTGSRGLHVLTSLWLSSAPF